MASGHPSHMKAAPPGSRSGLPAGGGGIQRIWVLSALLAALVATSALGACFGEGSSPIRAIAGSPSATPPVGKALSDAADPDQAITVPVGDQPDALAIDPSSGDVWVANALSDNVTVIDPSTETTVASIPVGSFPDAIAFVQGAGIAYVANLESGNLSIVDVSSLSVVGTMGGLAGPSSLVYVASIDRLFVADEYGSNVTVLNGTAERVVGSIPVRSGPTILAYDPGEGALFVDEQLLDNVTVLNATTGVREGSVSTPLVPSSEVYDPDLGEVLVGERTASYGDVGEVAAISGASFQLANFAVVPGPITSLAYDPIGGSVYAGGLSLFALTVLDASSLRIEGVIWGSSVGVSVFDGAANQLYTAATDAVVIYGTAASAMLGGVWVDPPTVVLEPGAHADLIAYPACDSGLCAPGTTFAWTVLSSSVGRLNATTGPNVDFTATGEGPSGTSVFVAASLDGVTVMGSTDASVPGGNTSPGATLLGLPWLLTVTLVVIIVAAAAVASVLILRRRRRAPGQSPPVEPPRTP